MTERSSADVERKLAAIMFTDIVGYTALMAESEEKGLRVRARHRELVRPLVEQYHGQSIEARGDESLSVFASALDAVNCALAIQAKLEEDAELRLHIGIHLGDIVVQGGEVSGDGVNIASRICSLSEGGGVCVSGEVYRSIRNQPDIEAVSLGERRLKNVGQPIAVYAVGRPGTVSKGLPAVRTRAWGRYAGGAAALGLIAVVAWWGWNRPVATPSPIRSIAVLPLENLSGDPEQEYFADGMTEVLIGDLAKLGSLSVISRTSVMRYKNSDKSLPEIARELNVDGVVEGTVMRAGDRVRITAQLIDARSDRHLWSDRYDRELSDVLALQSDVARAVAEQVRLELTRDEQAALTVSRSVDPRAYDAYLRGLQFRGPATLVATWGPKAIKQLKRAVELDPEFAAGHAALGWVRQELGIAGMGLRYRGEFLKARQAARRALELDEHIAQAHTALGLVRLYYDWDFAGARRAYERALQLSPSDPFTLNAYAYYLIWGEGKTEQSLAVAEHLLRVAPFDVFHRADRVRLFYYARRYERALEEVERARELAPDFVDFDIGNVYFALGRIQEGFRENVAFWETCGAPCEWELEAQERGWAEGGWDGALRAWLEVATAREGGSPWMIALNYASIGETDKAFAWLERGYRERDPLMILLRVAARFDPLRSDPRFDDLVRRIGFPES